MADVLTPLLALAALVLCVAALAKLRSPADAVRALGVVGVPASPLVVRTLALLEATLGLWCVARPSAVSDVALALIYACFSGLALLLASRGVTCGCFGERQEPASATQSLLSAALAAAAVAAAVWGGHGVLWVVGRPAASAATLILALGGALYATVLAYTELPFVWSAWTGGPR